MTLPRRALAVAAGVLLASIPFLGYAHLGRRGEAHADHEPRYGGQLGMVGDHHIELRRHLGKVEAFVSDAQRRPVRPSAGWVVFDGADATPLTWESRRLVGADTAPARVVEVVVLLADGTRLALSFDLTDPSSS